ncbi:MULTISPECIES: hypothetical protein [unclassified Streptomyces]|uniref:hypothetical protein n=1 Tax=unclassified Streptomyces TaxID=2593676 RepID=UPI002DDC7989|nr:hypothetical protein [Streptomyces sp. NBC_01768]WSC32316.1 hypothetical protein OG902_39660 [Streptomyces sp. NBC_01768]
MPDDSNGRLSVISIDVHLTPGSEIQEFLDEPARALRNIHGLDDEGRGAPPSEVSSGRSLGRCSGAGATAE